MSAYHPSNPYAPTLGNTLARLGVWVRGVVRMHRRALLLTLAAGATLAVGVNASEAPVNAAHHVASPLR